MTERDDAEEQADKLAACIEALLEVEIQEGWTMKWDLMLSLHSPHYVKKEEAAA